MRLTVAQALVRFLSRPVQRARRGRAAARRRLLRDLRPRQRGRGRAGAARVAGGDAVLPRPQRAGDGPRRGRLRAPEEPAVDAGLHGVGRPGRDEHGHRRGAGHDQPAAGAAVARRRVRHPAQRDPVLQELEDPRSYDVSVNDCLRPVSRYFDRINRPEQLAPALLAAMRVLTDPAETGAVTLALPQDVQAEAYDWPEELFARARVARAPAGARARRAGPGGRVAPAGAAAADRGGRRGDLRRGHRRPAHPRRGHGHPASRRPRRARARCRTTIRRTRARSGPPAPPAANAIAARGGRGARRRARAGATSPPRRAALFRRRGVRFINLNVAAFDASKHAGLPLVGRRARGPRGAARGAAAMASEHRAAQSTVGLGRPSSARTTLGHGPLPAQSEVIGAVNRAAGPARRRGVRGGPHARRPAQAVAHARPEGLPRRVRLLVHGLRDRRRPRASSWPRPTARCS